VRAAARRGADHGFGNLQLPRSLEAQLVPDQDELDRQRGDQGERCDVMQEGKECGQTRPILG
jgi:hypothetical protein